jgi:alpha-1,6-mannosyltransferase
MIRSAAVGSQEDNPSGALALAASAASVVLVATVASVTRSPFQPVQPPGVEPSGPFAWLARFVGVDRLGASALATLGVVAIAVAAVSFLLVLRAAWRGRVSTRAVLALAVAYHAAVLTLPLLFSRDVYSYAYYGRISGVYEANPYVSTPADFPADALASLVGPKWVDTTAVYGPLFTGLTAVLARLVDDVARLVSAFRWIAAAASLGTVALIAVTARRHRAGRAAFAVAAFGLNPVVLFQSVGSGHNDLLVALSIAGAFALVLARRDLFAVGVLALGALVKVSAALPLLLLVVWCVARRPAGERLRAIVTHGGLAAAITAVFAVPFFQLHDPTLGLLELAGHEGWLAPSRLFRRVLDAVSGDTLGVVARVAFAALLIGCVLLVAREVWRRARDGPALGAAWGWTLLLLMLLGPVLLPWYVTWSLPLVWLLPRVPRAVLIATSAALTLSQWTAEPARFGAAYDVNVLVGHYVITPVVVGLLAWLLSDLHRRLSAGAALQDEDRVPAGAGDR